MAKKEKVFLGIPHQGTVSAATIGAVMNATRRHDVSVVNAKHSLLACNFNSLWCTALNGRAEHGWTRFAMLHADVSPGPHWLDDLIEEQDDVGADIISAVIPLKNNRGLTSTGVFDDDRWGVRRLTMREILELPETFATTSELPPEIGIGDCKVLAVNTGLLVADFTKPWVEEVCFTIRDRVDRLEDGTFAPSVLPEDWGFSLWAHDHGLKVFATRRVALDHVGDAKFTNRFAWGDWEVDQEWEASRKRPITSSA